ncbi:AAA family ATPase [Natronoarchaeum mannanilyticum]|uniref:Replication factor C small subunit n=1 Tax=Natronoarchaeum mannanilyticum TaxID=926360 RepID=A0AAV3T8D6_9EURY
MEPPLWIDEHAPALEDLPQEDVRDYLTEGVDEPINLVLHGPPGSGKTAAVRALADAAHENPDSDLIEINVADFFDRTKTEIKNDPRFASFLEGKSDMAKRDMINHVLKESASYAPVSGEYKTILLDNAEAVREDFQQALRRVMEQHHKTTQFVLTTRQPTKLIPPIRSRCFPVPVRAPSHEEIVSVLEGIADDEDAEYDADGLEYVAGYAAGDLRKAILGTQTTYEQEGEITMNAAYETLGEVGTTDRIEEMLDDAEAGEFTDARKTLDDLLVEEGLEGEEVLRDVLAVAQSRYDDRAQAELYRAAGEVDLDLTEGTNDRLHVSHLLSRIPEIA